MHTHYTYAEAQLFSILCLKRVGRGVGTFDTRFSRRPAAFINSLYLFRCDAKFAHKPTADVFVSSNA